MAQFLTPEIADHYLTALDGPPISEQVTLRMEAVIEEPPTQMIFTCMSHSPEAVKQCMKESGLIYLDAVEFNYERASISVFFPDDTLYYDLSMWAGHAFACGLISLPHIER